MGDWSFLQFFTVLYGNGAVGYQGIKKTRQEKGGLKPCRELD
jgi:hypothetical protein